MSENDRAILEQMRDEARIRAIATVEQIKQKVMTELVKDTPIEHIRCSDDVTEKVDEERAKIMRNFIPNSQLSRAQHGELTPQVATIIDEIKKRVKHSFDSKGPISDPTDVVDQRIKSILQRARANVKRNLDEWKREHQDSRVTTQQPILPTKSDAIKKQPVNEKQKQELEKQIAALTTTLREKQQELITRNPEYGSGEEIGSVALRTYIAELKAQIVDLQKKFHALGK